jgi:hypothetical protein
VDEIGLGDGLETEKRNAEHGGGGVKAEVLFSATLSVFVARSLQREHKSEEGRDCQESTEKEQVEVHGAALCRDGSQAWIGAPIMAAAMYLIVAGSGLRGRGTLEERGPDVAVRCNNVVLTWLVRDACVDRLDEEKYWEEEEESSIVMARCVGKQKEYDSEQGCQEGECLPSADFWRADHCWTECTRRSDCYEYGMARFGCGQFPKTPFRGKYNANFGSCNQAPPGERNPVSHS